MGVNTGKEMRAKIHKLSSEVSETKKYYSDKISSLKQREQAIRQRATLYQKMPLQNADKINKLKEEWTKVRAEIKQLTSEKDSKIQELGTQLEALKRDYRDNHEHYKQADKKVNSDKLKDIKIFISDHKFAIISAICVLAIAVIAGITSIIIDISSTVARPNDFIGLTINDAIKLAKQKGLKTDVWGSSYDPNAQDEQTVTYVSSVYFADGKQDYHYNKYTNGDMPLKSGYKISLETDDITKAQQTKIDECKSQGDRYHYRFKDGDLECYAEQTEEEKKAQCEAEGKWYRESQCKSQEEWETEYQWRAAHNACKKYGSNAYAKTLTDCYVGTDYKGTVDGKSEAENTENSESATVNEQPAQNQESESDNNSSDSGGGFFEQLFGNSGKKYRTRTIKDGESCPSDTQVCIISDKAYGYPTLNYGTYSGRVINNTPDDFSYIQVTANNYNASGIKIGDCIANSSGLNSGGTWAFEAYCSAWSEGGTIGDIDVSWW